MFLDSFFLENLYISRRVYKYFKDTILSPWQADEMDDAPSPPNHHIKRHLATSSTLKCANLGLIQFP